MKPAHFTTALLALAPVASAFPWPRWLPDLDSLVVRRAADTTATASAAAATTAATTADAESATNLNTAGITKTTAADTATGTATGTGTDDASGTATGTGTDASASGGTTSSVSVSSGAGAGSAVMLTPVTTLTSAFYRIGEFVTMKWNYTNLAVEPTAVDVLISCTTASETWTLTSNMTFETKGAFTWDSGAYQSKAAAQPLIVEEYILYIVDADSSIGATAGAGSLTANAAVTFGLYTGQPYTALSSGWVCATCSGAALSTSERQAIGFLFTVSAITVASFTWFVTGLW